MNPRELNSIGAVATSVLALLLFAAALAAAYVMKDQTAISLLDGAVVSMATSVVSFWIGSSAGSQKKDQMLASSIPVPAPIVPPA